MTSRNDFRMAPPQQVYDSYKEIRDSEFIRNKVLSDKNIEGFQLSLNNSQPISEEESKIRSLIQYFYRKNPTNFCRFLVRSKLNHLILWTEAKCIVRHFGLRGIVYVKWNDNSYECSLHRHADSNLQEPDLENPSAQRIYKSVEENYSYDNRSHSDNRGDRPDNNRYQRNEMYGNYRDRRPQSDNRGDRRPQSDNRGDRRPQSDNYRGDRRPQSDNYRGDRRPQSDNYRGGNSQSYSNDLPANTVDNFPTLPTRPAVQETDEQLSQSSEEQTEPSHDLTASVAEVVPEKLSYSASVQTE
jgi:hypothetical protein